MSAPLITDESIKEKIVKDYKSGLLLRELSEKYEVGRSVITRILINKNVEFRGHWTPTGTRLSTIEAQEKIKKEGGKICSKCGQFKDLSHYRLINKKGRRSEAIKIFSSCCKECSHEARKIRQYNLNEGDIQKILESQNYRCAICGKELKEDQNIDHNHITGEVRGILCSKCNLRVGSFETFRDEIINYLIQTQKRPDKDEWLMDIARQVSRRSTCSRKKVGAILVNEGRILTMGYNGAPTGVDHCEHEIGESLEDGCKISVHAEINCFLWAARWGIKTDGSTLYTTLSPCINCSNAIINSGVEKVVIGELYRDTKGLDLLEDSGIEIVILDNRGEQ